MSSLRNWRFVTIAVSLLFCFPLRTQTLPNFFKSYNVVATSYGGGLAEMNDGSIVFTSTNIDTIWSPIYNDSIVIETLTLIKVDPNGTPLWAKDYIVNGNCAYGGSFLMTRDSCFLYSSVAFADSIYDPEFLLFKVDKNGNLLWNKTYGAFGNEYSLGLVRDSIDNFFLSGYSDSHSQADGDLHIVKTDSTGEQIWSKSYVADTTYEYPIGLAIDDKANLFMAGQQVDVYGNYLTAVLKTDSAGTIKYFKSLKESDSLTINVPVAMYLASNKSLLVAGERYEFDSSYYNLNSGFSLFKIDSTGNLLYSKFYHVPGDTTTYFYPILVREKTNGDYVVFSFGTKYDTASYEEFTLFTEISPAGNILTTKKLKLSGTSLYPTFAEISNNNNAWIVNSISFSDSKTILCKMDLDYNLGCAVTGDFQLTADDILINMKSVGYTVSICTDSTSSIAVVNLDVVDSTLCEFIPPPPGGGSPTNPPAGNIPNVFSPNGDGVNDSFTFSLGEFNVSAFEIYNRWGQKVFETFESTINWNGKHFRNGTDCVDGTYYYIYNTVDFANKEKKYKGYILLTR